LPREVRGLRVPAWLLSLLIVVQILLGGATYVAKYAFPAWLGDFAFAANYVVQDKGLAQSLITTAHVANGSLILFVCVLVAMRAEEHTSELQSPDHLVCRLLLEKKKKKKSNKKSIKINKLLIHM